MNDITGQSMLAAALEYAKAGHKVLPLKPGGKSPNTINGSKDATTDADEIRDWWTENPNDNIGIVPNPGQYVIDVDDHAAFAALVAELGELPSDCPVADTPRGGRHYWVSYMGGDLRGDLARMFRGVDAVA